MVELVKGRLAEDIQPWFAAHPQVEIVTRDRSADYRKGLTLAALQATQFRTLLKERCVAAFDIWLDSADLNPLKTVRNFSKSLRDEYSFIRAALESDKCMAAPALNSCA